MSLLESLKSHTIVVADTGDFESIAQFAPQDATTNPSLILQAAKIEAYRPLIDDAIAYAKAFETDDPKERIMAGLRKVAVNFGVEILKIVPGRVSTELDARLSFDTQSTIAQGREIIRLYSEAGIDKERILLKIASTWEGIEAARVLESEGIHCNLTLLFSFAQAAACAEAGVTLISPFVGRIRDWYLKSGIEFDPKVDPGVISVRRIYNYYRKFGYETVIMGASFRNLDEITALCGVDLLTISPKFLAELSSGQGELEVCLSSEMASQRCEFEEKVEVTESWFRFEMCEDAMGIEKLSEGIRRFSADIRKLEVLIKEGLPE